MPLKFNPLHTPTVFVMVGLPYSGKSTYIKKDKILRKLPILDTDSYIENYAKEKNKSYSDVFAKTIGRATDRMNSLVNANYKFGQSFILDQTNLSVEKRAKIIKKAKENSFKVVALSFAPYKDEAKLKQRIELRKDKKIPMQVLKTMASKFVLPTEAEGFDQVIWVDGWNED